ncbi:hypothetical protein LAUMK13_05796 [Mycobacterium innocens]|uniref:Uncharacterized protein n=1 Tax=Mycobacterium innocens TaxID=2341083 RepID=A0A498QIA8_9MYCO|nr:hypothetical protein LAUMK13_05796 [Mycobacterium innocens]
MFDQVAADGEPGDELGVHVPSGHGLDVADVGIGLGQTSLAAKPVQLVVSPALVLPVDGLLDHLRPGQGPDACRVGEFFEVLGHA